MPINPQSRAMRDQAASIPHIGNRKELGDLRSDVDAAFGVVENRPTLTRITGGSTALSLAGLPTAKPLVGVGLLVSKAKSSLVINEGTTAELTFTAQRPGTPGDDITVQVVDSAGGGLAVTAVGNVIEIDLGGATPDAATILAAMDALPAALNLVATAHDGVAGAGLPLVMAAAENLDGGTGDGFEVYVNGIVQTLGGPVTDTAIPMIITDLTGAANLDEAQVRVVTDGLELQSMQVLVVT